MPWASSTTPPRAISREECGGGNRALQLQSPIMATLRAQVLEENLAPPVQIALLLSGNEFAENKPKLTTKTEGSLNPCIAHTKTEGTLNPCIMEKCLQKPSLS